MEGVSVSAGAGCQKRITEEGQGAQPDENPHQVFRFQDSAVRNFHGRYRNLGQVQPPFHFLPRNSPMKFFILIFYIFCIGDVLMTKNNKNCMNLILQN